MCLLLEWKQVVEHVHSQDLFIFIYWVFGGARQKGKQLDNQSLNFYRKDTAQKALRNFIHAIFWSGICQILPLIWLSSIYKYALIEWSCKEPNCGLCAGHAWISSQHAAVFKWFFFMLIRGVCFFFLPVTGAAFSTVPIIASQKQEVKNRWEAKEREESGDDSEWLCCQIFHGNRVDKRTSLKPVYLWGKSIVYPRGMLFVVTPETFSWQPQTNKVMGADVLMFKKGK